MKTLRLGLLCVTVLTGCSLKDLRDLKKNAKDLPAKATQAAEKADATVRIKREVDGVDIQLKTFTLMRLAPTDRERVSLSRIFFRAFEFQKWTGQTNDTPAVKQEFYRKAFYIFLPLASGLIPKNFPARPRWLSRDWRLLGVLTVAMDEVDPTQGTVPGQPAESMYSLIEKAWTEPSGDDANTYAPLVREWSTEVRYLLNVRYNYLLALATERLTSVEFGYAEQLGASSWPASILRNVGPERLAAVADLIRRAARTRDLLIGAGAPVDLAGVIRRRVLRVRDGLDPHARELVFATLGEF